MTTINDRFCPVRPAALALLVVLALALPAPAQESGDIHEGRGSFLIQQIPLGIWYGYGMSQFLTNDSSSAKIQTAVGLLGASAFYFGPMALVWNKPMSNAQAHLSVAMGYRGIPAGFALGDLFNLGRETYGYNVRPRMGLMVATSLGAQVGGYFLARDMSLGRATLVTAYSDFGWFDGMLAYGATRSAFDRRNPKSSPFFLAGLVGGAALGVWRQQHFDCTEGQVTFDRTAGTLGAAIPPALIWSLTAWGDAGKEPAWLASFAILGNVAGVYTAERIAGDVPISTGDGYIITGCTAGGALLGAGIGYLFTNPNDRGGGQLRPVIGVATLGAVGGMALGMRLTHVWPTTTALNARPERDGWARVNVNFGAAAGAATRYATSRSFSAPQLITVEF